MTTTTTVTDPELLRIFLDDGEDTVQWEDTEWQKSVTVTDDGFYVRRVVELRESGYFVSNVVHMKNLTTLAQPFTAEKCHDTIMIRTRRYFSFFRQ